MSLQISIWIAVCLAVMLAVLVILRKDKASLGLPFAFVALVALQHLPGAWVYVLNPYYSVALAEVTTGIRITAFAFVAFLVGMLGMRLFARRQVRRRAPGGRVLVRVSRPLPPHHRRRDGPIFWLFCLFGGWFVLYGLGAFVSIPSLGAALDKGSSVWMLGVMLGLQNALVRRDLPTAAIWGSTLAVNSVLSLVLAAFLSSASTVAGIVLSFLTVTTRSLTKVIITMVVVCALGLTIFVNYFTARTQIRDTVWGGASISQRLDVLGDVVARFKVFDPSNDDHLRALDRRLNQNYFIGVAVDRLESGATDYLHGRSLWEGVVSLIPRALWPEKPVFGGSGTLVIDATGLDLSTNTAWGVGSVMEFYINFGLPGLIIGFIVLGGLIGGLDRHATLALREGNLPKVFVFFAPCVALIQPLGSLVELTSGAAAALLAGFFWRWAWIFFVRNFTSPTERNMPPRRQPVRSEPRPGGETMAPVYGAYRGHSPSAPPRR